MERKLDISILYVENDKSIRSYFTEFLENKVEKVFVAIHGRDGVRLFKEHKPDIVITDINMPEMDGLEMLKLIKRRHDVKSLVITGYEKADLFLKAIDIGVDKFIIKPANEDKLLENIKELVDNLLLDKKLNEKEQELVSSEQRFKALSDATEDAIFIIEKGICVECNKAATIMFGYSFDELKGDTGTKVIATRSTKIVQKNMLRGTEHPFEVMGERKDGSLFPAEYGIKRFNYKGKIAQTITISDISKKKDAEKNLRISEHRLKRAQAVAHVGSWEIDLKTNMVWGSEEAFRIFGIDTHRGIAPYEELMMQTLPEYKDYLDNALKELIDNDIPYDVQYEIIRKSDEKKVYVHSIGRLKYDAYGNPNVVIGTIQDITEQKNIEQALANREKQYSEIVNAVRPIVYRTDEKTNEFVFVSQSAEKILGYPVEDWLNDKYFWINHIHPDDKEHTVQYSSSETNNLRSHVCEYRMIAKDGRSVWLRDVVNTIVEEGKPKELIGVMVDITDKKRVEQKLKESEERLEYALEGSREGVWDWDLVTNEILFSKRLKQIWGYDEDDLKGTYEETKVMMHPDDLERTKRDINRCLEGKTEYYENEHRIKTKSGSYIWVLTRGKVIGRDEFDKPIRMIGTHIDVTDKKRIEIELIDAKKNFETLYNQTPIMLHSINSNGEIVNVSDNWLETMGYERDEVIGRKSLDFLTEKSRQKAINKILPIFFETGSIRDVSYQYLKKNGEIIDVLLSADSYYDSNNKYVKSNAVSVNVTERNKDKQQLRESLKLSKDLQFALDESSIVSMADIHKNITYVNDKFCQITKYSRNELMNKNHSILRSDSHSEMFYREIGEHIANGNIWKGEIKQKSKDGKYFWTHATVVPLLDENKKPYQYIGIQKEITARKSAEEKLLNYKDQLEEIIDQRTSELKIANKELESFSYSITHDLRTPLKAVEGFTELIKEEYFQNIDEEAQRLFDIIHNNIARMSELINDLLEFSKMGNKAINLGQVDLKPFVEELVEEVNNSMQNEKVKVVIHELPRKKIDKSMMKQVFINLLMNGLKFSKNKKSPIVEIGAYVDANNEDVLYIKDNGVGFDMKYMDKLFTIFQRLHSEDEFEGTGIGLSIVKRVIDKHSGKIWAESELNKGATFYFSLP